MCGYRILVRRTGQKTWNFNPNPGPTVIEVSFEFVSALSDAWLERLCFQTFFVPASTACSLCPVACFRKNVTHTLETVLLFFSPLSLSGCFLSGRIHQRLHCCGSTKPSIQDMPLTRIPTVVVANGPQMPQDKNG